MPSACLAREHGERLPAISSKNRLVMLEFSRFPDLLQPILAILSSVSESGRDETTFVFNGDFVASTSELAAQLGCANGCAESFQMSKDRGQHQLETVGLLLALKVWSFCCFHEKPGMCCHCCL